MSEDESSPFDGEYTASDTGALAQAVEESRETLDHQIDLIDEIDDKAMRSTRIAVVVIGFVVSAFGIAGPDTISNIPDKVIADTAIGVTALAFSALVGIGTYAVSDPPYGIGESYRQDVKEGSYSTDEWYLQLLDGYDEWSADLRDMISKNVVYLSVAQWLLAVGLLFLLRAASHPISTVLASQGAIRYAKGVVWIAVVTALWAIFLWRTR